MSGYRKAKYPWKDAAKLLSEWKGPDRTKVFDEPVSAMVMNERENVIIKWIKHAHVASQDKSGIDN